LAVQATAASLSASLGPKMAESAARASAARMTSQTSAAGVSAALASAARMTTQASAAAASETLAAASG
jgi:hypothetical protein